MKKRIVYIDIARGIAIIGMLIGHAMSIFDCKNIYISGWFWSFHMPLFAILSGYFFKDYGFLKHVQNGFKTLILPYYFVSLLSFLTLFVIQICNGTIDISNSWNFLWKIIYIHPRTEPFGFWFVLALFLARLLFCVIKKVSKNDLSLFLWSLILFIIAFYYLPFENAYLYYPQAMMFPLYMCIGYLWNKFGVFDHFCIWLFLLSLVVLSFAWLFDVDLVHFRFPLGLFNIITTSIISFSLLYICKLISNYNFIIIRAVVYGLSFCGKHSLMILGIHSYLIFTQFWRKIYITNPTVLSVIFISGTLLLSVALDWTIRSIRKRSFEKQI